MKKLFLKIKKEYGIFLSKYPFTNIWCVIGAILISLCYKDVIEENFLLFIITLLNCLIFTETFISKNIIKIIPTIISIVLSILVYQYVPDNNLLLLIYMGIMLIIDIFTIGKIIKDKDIKLDKYIYKTFINYIPLYIVQSILFFGVLFSGLLLDGLVFANMDLDITSILEILLIFGLLLPMNLYVVTQVPNTDSKIIDKIITYALIPVGMIMNLMMIIYVGKCLFTWSLPDIDVFMIIFAIYFVTYLSVLLSNNIKDKNKLNIFNNKYMLVFLCINIVMQLFSLLVRICYYGITLPRMICIYIIIFEIISIVLYYVEKNKYINKLVDVSFIIVIFACIIPFINIYELPLYYHGNRVINYIDGKKIELKTAVSSYRYLNDYFDGNSYNKKYIKGKSLKEIEKVICYDSGEYVCNYNYYDDKTMFNYGMTIELDIDISNYKKIKHVSTNISDFKLDELKEVKMDHYYINVYNLCTNLIEIGKKYNNKNEEKYDYNLDEYFRKNNIIVIDENSVFVIEEFVFDYDKNNSKDSYLDISGYILEK